MSLLNGKKKLTVRLIGELYDDSALPSEHTELVRKVFVCIALNQPYEFETVNNLYRTAVHSNSSFKREQKNLVRKILIVIKR